MTPSQLTGLAALLIEFRDWIERYTDDAPLDVEVVNHTVSVVVLYHRMLLEDGAR